MKPFLLLILFIIGTVVGMAIVPLLPDGVQEGISDFQEGVRHRTTPTGTVRILYAVPADREFRSDYSQAIQHAIVDIQSWYRQELDGATFSLYNVAPEQCRMSETEDFYSRGDAWREVLEGVQHCAPVQAGTATYAWVIYPDVIEDCDEPQELGRGGLGLTILHHGDLEGLTNPGLYYHCAEGPYAGPLERWIGGLGHELGHALGLPHPPGCEAELPTCDRDALMAYGYAAYPNTYFRSDDKAMLLRSPFIRR